MEQRKIQQYKIDAVKELKDLLSDTKDLIFTDFRGLSVEKITELRKMLYEKDSLLKIVKNNYTRIALKDFDFPEVDSILEGPTAIAMIKTDSSAIAKIISDYSKNEAIKIKGGIVGGKRFEAFEIEALSKLPSREQLIAMLMGTMNAPVRNVMYALNGVVQKLVWTLQAVADKKGDSK
jgi:large subunit ribosomal protein L10